jgi:hypothetical protein
MVAGAHPEDRGQLLPAVRLARMTDRLLRDRCVATGGVTEADFDELDGAHDDPSFWFVSFTAFGAWGRRPGSRGAGSVRVTLVGPRTRAARGRRVNP